MTTAARPFHEAAEQAREAKKYPEALALYDQALIKYVAGEDIVGISELHAARSIVYRHLADQAETEMARRLWLAEVEAAVDQAVQVAKLAAEKGQPTGMALALFNQAKFYEMTENFAQAVPLFTQALEWLEKSPPPSHDRPVVVWDFKLKLALAHLEGGDPTALSAVLAALDGLAQDREVDADYSTKVWRSGGYLHLAKYFSATDKVQAQNYLAEAEKIANSDERLVIRREEILKLKKQVGF